MKKIYEAQDFMIRYPKFSCDNLVATENADEFLIMASENREFMEQLLVASESTYKMLNDFISGNTILLKNKNKLKIFETVYKYWNRNHIRTIPFGLFSKVNIGSFGNKNILEIKPKSDQKSITIDTEWLLKLIKIIEDEMKDKLHYTLNNASYILGDRVCLMYCLNEKNIERKNIRFTNVYNIIENSSRGEFKTLDSLTNILLKDYGEEYADNIKHYLDNLIDNEFLISELYFSLMDNNPLQRIMEIISIVDKKNLYIKYILKIEDLNDSSKMIGLLEKINMDFLKENGSFNLNMQLGNWFNDGRQLSGGQWQKIGLVRALIKPASLYILDEPNAELDSVSEKSVFDTFLEYSKESIAIFVSHKISAARKADRIIVMDNGVHDLSLFSGLSGMGLAISCASQNGKRYKKFISSINEYLSLSVEENIDQIDYKNLSPIDYDVIGGVSGILSYLLIYKSDENISKTIYKSIDFLMKCFERQSIKEYKVPYVYIKKEILLSDNERLIFPNGCLNTGISHGISGIAAILSIAMMEGFMLDKQKETIEEIIKTLDKSYIVEEDKYIWKGGVDYKEYTEGKCNDKNIFRRDAWCYGAPRIALAYLYAGLALNKKECVDKANERYIKAVNKLDGIYSPILCHGYAGVLEIGKTLLQFRSEDSTKKAIDDLYEITYNSYDKNSNYGFQNFEYEENKLKSFDGIGLLDGSAGVLLACFGYLNKTNTSWRRSLLLL